MKTTKLDDFEDAPTLEDRFQELQSICRQLPKDEQALFWRGQLAQDRSLLQFVRADRMPRKGRDA